MLIITVPGIEVVDEATNEFGTIGDITVELEHSLVSLSKWESKFEKPFLGKDERTTDEFLSYVKAMIVTPNLLDTIIDEFSEENFKSVVQYIDSKMTATWFRDDGAPPTKEIVTAELIYYWMTIFSIPFECENWHLNRLFTLIRICNLKQGKPKKMGRAEAAQRQRDLNARRKAELGTKG